VERLRIDSDGNVGIGTSAPVAGLHARKSVAIAADSIRLNGDQVLRLSAATGSAGGREIFEFGRASYTTGGSEFVNLVMRSSIGDNNFNAGWYQEVFRPRNTNGNGNYFSIGQLTRVGGGPASQTERLRIDSAGNVGIGTSSPSYTIESVSATSNNLLRLRSESTTPAGAVSELRVNTGANSVDLVTGSGDSLLFSPDFTEAMRITSAGNVGIGTSSPGAKLEVSSGATDHLRLTRTAGAYWDVGVGSSLALITKIDGVEAMRITSGGKILAAAGTNWVGTVSESGQSSVIQRGSNANGEFVRYADGTQICQHIISFTTDQSSNLGRRSGLGTWSFPASFINTEYASFGSANNINREFFCISSGLGTATSCQFRMYNIDRTGDESRSMRLIAFGRWY
jgi:hypothetical protein